MLRSALVLGVAVLARTAVAQVPAGESSPAPAEQGATGSGAPLPPVPGVVEPYEPYVLVRAGAAGGVSFLQGSWGLGAEVAGGMWLYRFVGVEMSVGYAARSGTQKGYLPGDGVDHGGVTVSYKQDADVRDELTLVPFLFNARVGLPAGPVRPYLLAGAGLTYAHVVREPGASYVWLAPGAEHQSADVSVFSWQAGAGATFRLSPRLLGTLEARYFGTGKAAVLGDTASFDTFLFQLGVASTF